MVSSTRAALGRGTGGWVGSLVSDCGDGLLGGLREASGLRRLFSGDGGVAATRASVSVTPQVCLHGGVVGGDCSERFWATGLGNVLLRRGEYILLAPVVCDCRPGSSNNQDDGRFGVLRVSISSGRAADCA